MTNGTSISKAGDYKTAKLNSGVGELITRNATASPYTTGKPNQVYLMVTTDPTFATQPIFYLTVSMRPLIRTITEVPKSQADASEESSSILSTPLSLIASFETTN